MFRSPWLRNLFAVARSRKDRRRLSARTRKPVRLMLESLEERLTPSGGNPTVTQTAGGYTALTAAIKSDTAANTNYVIQITNSFTFNSGGQVSISKLGASSTLTLEGQNGSNFTLTGNGNRLFDVAKGQNVTFAAMAAAAAVLKAALSISRSKLRAGSAASVVWRFSTTPPIPRSGSTTPSRAAQRATAARAAPPPAQPRTRMAAMAASAA